MASLGESYRVGDVPGDVLDVWVSQPNEEQRHLLHDHDLEKHGLSERAISQLEATACDSP